MDWNRNDARFLWKRIPLELKQASETLNKAWAIGKALWQRYAHTQRDSIGSTCLLDELLAHAPLVVSVCTCRDLAAAYAAMDASWPQALEPLVRRLRGAYARICARIV